MMLMMIMDDFIFKNTIKYHIPHRRVMALYGKWTAPLRGMW